MGWYSQGTQVVDFTENANGTVDFRETGYFIPENANTWVSHVFKVERHRDGSFTYYGATGDFNIGAGGRNAIDVYKVRLPGPPIPKGGPPPGTPNYPLAAEDSAAGATACKSSLGFSRASAKGRRRGLAFSFRRTTRNPVKVDVFRTTRGRRVTGERRVARFDRRSRSFRWNGRGRRVRDGYYIVRFAVRAPNGATDFRRVAFRRKGGRFRKLPAYFRGKQCSLVETFKLKRPVFGGTTRRKLGIAFRLGRAARVRITVTRKGKVVKRFRQRTYNARRTYRLRLGAKGRKRGLYRVTLRAQRPGATATTRLSSRKL
jgi:hypothetical protein